MGDFKDRDARDVFREYVETLEQFQDQRKVWTKRIKTLVDRRNSAIEKWREGGPHDAIATKDWTEKLSQYSSAMADLTTQIRGAGNSLTERNDELFRRVKEMLADENLEITEVLRFMRDENRRRIAEIPFHEATFESAEGLQEQLEEYAVGEIATSEGTVKQERFD